MDGVALNIFPNVLLIFNIRQSLLIIYLLCGKVGLYVTENGSWVMCKYVVCVFSCDILGYFYEQRQNVQFSYYYII